MNLQSPDSSVSLPTLTTAEATRIVQRFCEGILPSDERLLDIALSMKQLTRETVAGFIDAAKAVTKHRDRGLVLTPMGGKRRRLETA